MNDCQDGYDRPKVEQWRAACPDLVQIGRELVGPCPHCGGTDRFLDLPDLGRGVDPHVALVGLHGAYGYLFDLQLGYLLKQVVLQCFFVRHCVVSY